MEKESARRGESCLQLLDLMPKERGWMVRDPGGGGRSTSSVADEEKELALKLGPPGGEDWPPAVKEETKEKSSLLSSGYFSKPSINLCSGAKRGFSDIGDRKSRGCHQQQGKLQAGLHQLKGGAGLGMELSLKTCGEDAEGQQQSHESKACCASVNAAGSCSSSRPRAAAVPVVGWPPVRSFRKNLASSSSKPPPEPQNGEVPAKAKLDDSRRKGLMLKIYMDGIPIGRKVDLATHSSYEKLSEAVKVLFQGLHEARKDASAVESGKHGEERTFSGLLDGTGEYTLVYEDNEGEWIMVGDVPWNMFLTTAKRLRVRKSSELS